MCTFDPKYIKETTIVIGYDEDGNEMMRITSNVDLNLETLRESIMADCAYLDKEKTYSLR